MCVLHFTGSIPIPSRGRYANRQSYNFHTSILCHFLSEHIFIHKTNNIAVKYIYADFYSYGNCRALRECISQTSPIQVYPIYVHLNENMCFSRTSIDISCLFHTFPNSLQFLLSTCGSEYGMEIYQLSGGKHSIASHAQTQTYHIPSHIAPSYITFQLNIF